jgi:hypothetical protein
MQILYPAGVWAAILVCASVFGAHALKMRTDKNYREAWGSATLSLLPAAIFWIFVIGGEPDMLKRTMLLLPVGAVFGACLFAYAGYVIADIKRAKAQTPQEPPSQNQPQSSSPPSSGPVGIRIAPGSVGEGLTVRNSTFRNVDAAIDNHGSVKGLDFDQNQVIGPTPNDKK